MSAPTGVAARTADAESTSPAASSAGQPGASVGGTGGRGRRRWLLAAAVVAGVLAIGLLFAALAPGPTSSVPLDPRNPGPSGAQALAEVLGQQGVDVTIARGQAELERTTIDADTSVLVARTDNLATSTSLLLGRLSGAAARLVVVDPQRAVVRALDPTVGVQADARTEPVAVSCSTTEIREGERLSRSQVTFSAPAAASQCFTDDDGSVYLETRPQGSAPLVFFGSGSALTNQEVTEADNAAIALRMLGHSPRLVWYVPSRDDLPEDQDSPTAAVPRWIGPATLLLCAAVLALMLWRGRRLGALVREPLPVTVRAIETTESRGRMYRRSRDAVRAGSVLQEATRHRLGTALGLPPTAPVAALVDAVATAAGRPAPEVGSLLAGPPPADDTGLLQLANALTTLEEEVRAP